MDQRFRIVVATSILLVGLLLAMLFRHPPRQAEVRVPGTSDHLVLRKRTAPVEEPRAEPAGQPSPKAPAGVEPRRLPPTLLKPADGGATPPDLAKSYPVPETSRWGISMGQMLPETNRPATPPPSVHKIVDGDTLATLAERYLGSADRAMELFDANSSVLSNPQLLPIGAELKIPPRERPPMQSISVTPDRPMVPVVQ